MAEFLSTEAVTLISFLCRKMPGLLKYILQFSTAVGKKEQSSPIPLLSAQQIQEARKHPSTIIQQALKTVAVAQGALNSSATKLNTLTQQRNNIETTLTKLLALNKTDKT